MSREQEIIDCLEKRLESYDSYCYFERNVEYSRGEMDLYAERIDGRRVYFEIKTNHHNKKYNKAKKQFKRAKKFNKADVFIYVTPQLIKRCYL